MLDVLLYDISPHNPRRSIGSFLIPVLSQLHTSMFSLPPVLVPRSGVLIYPDPTLRHFFAYWIFTYGIIRLCSTDSTLVAYSYYIEAIAIANECFIQKTMRVDKSVFVIFSSILLGYAAYI